MAERTQCRAKQHWKESCQRWYRKSQLKKKKWKQNKNRKRRRKSAYQKQSEGREVRVVLITLEWLSRDCSSSSSGSSRYRCCLCRRRCCLCWCWQQWRAPTTQRAAEQRQRHCLSRRSSLLISKNVVFVVVDLPIIFRLQTILICFAYK